MRLPDEPCSWGCARLPERRSRDYVVDGINDVDDQVAVYGGGRQTVNAFRCYNLRDLKI